MRVLRRACLRGLGPPFHGCRLLWFRTNVRDGHRPGLVPLRLRGSQAGGQRGPVAVASGVLTTPPSDPLAERLAALFGQLRALIAELSPEVVVVERVLFQANARTAMSVGQASGLALAAAAEVGIPVVQYSPNEVKQAVTGWGRRREGTGAEDGAGLAAATRETQPCLTARTPWRSPCATWPARRSRGPQPPPLRPRGGSR